MKFINAIPTADGLGIKIMSADENDKHSYFYASAFGYAIIVCLGEIFSPGKEWVDLSKSLRANSLGYWTPCKRVYGFQYCRGYAKLFYGPQKSFNEPSHFKKLRMPWNEWRYVRRSLFGSRGECYHTLEAPNIDAPEVKAIEESLLNIFIAFCPKAIFRFQWRPQRDAIAVTYIEEREWRLGVGVFSWLSWFKRPKIQRRLLIFSNTAPLYKDGSMISIRPDESHEDAFKRLCQHHNWLFLERLQDIEDEAHL